MTRQRHGELTPDQVRAVCDPSQFSFKSTADVPALTEVMGQERAVRALSFGLGVRDPGFNIFVVGPTGSGRTSTVLNLLRERAGSLPQANDWCYINSFANPRKPKCIRLPVGKGKSLRDDMAALVAALRTDVPRTLKAREHQAERAKILEELDKARSERLLALEEEARRGGFTITRTQAGLLVLPTVRGQPMTESDFQKLEPERRRQLEQAAQSTQQALARALADVREVEREAQKRYEELQHRAVRFAVDYRIAALKEKYQEFDGVLGYLAEVEEDVTRNLQDFLPQDEETPGSAPAEMFPRARPSFERYVVNVIVDRTGAAGAPVVVESDPSPANLMGRVERRAEFGMLLTDFTMIRAGSLHRANGGYLVLDAEGILRYPAIWGLLKRALKSREVRMADPAEVVPWMSTTVEPDPIPLDVKVIIVGTPPVYHFLYALDEEFRELFKVKADFHWELDRTSENTEKLARFIADRCREDALRPFDPSGVARLVEYSSELASDQRRLTARLGAISDLMREANYWSGQRGASAITKEDVQRAIRERIDRVKQIEEKVHQLIREDTILIDTQGTAIGQVNGIAVAAIGDHAFGKPTRITASTFLGAEGVVNIEREAKLSGRLHDKGAMILVGYLGAKYGQDTPLAFSARVCFEQSYEEMEGDSAASAELYALLSSLGELPLDQGIAVTGSVNQRGEVQPVGGVMEKVAGFFDVCKAKGTTGEQGVIIPRGNVSNLMLREDIVQAIADGQFHIYPVGTIDEGLAILTGRRTGKRRTDGAYPEGSANAAIARRLAHLASKWRWFAGRARDDHSRGSPAPGPSERPARAAPGHRSPGREGNEQRTDGPPGVP
ncbi:MAG: AAA family ATPase [Chloroflexi bacterium]|nr:AAA family ATPase [Chloroflexota bacterium]